MPEPGSDNDSDPYPEDDIPEDEDEGEEEDEDPDYEEDYKVGRSDSSDTPVLDRSRSAAGESLCCVV